MNARRKLVPRRNSSSKFCAIGITCRVNWIVTYWLSMEPVQLPLSGTSKQRRSTDTSVRLICRCNVLRTVGITQSWRSRVGLLEDSRKHLNNGAQVKSNLNHFPYCLCRV
uniref:Uncharacterized protein n=1 Tax=Trichuris muris TaxID=70415 RepID=A0A5S6QCF4_TRIMR